MKIAVQIKSGINPLAEHLFTAIPLLLFSCLYIGTIWSLFALTCVFMQSPYTENSKQIFPEKELRGHSSNFHIHVSESDLYISTIDLPILLQEICG
jgi:hypothetical protein